MSADVAGAGVVARDGVGDWFFHADDVGQHTVRGEIGDDGQQVVQGGDRCRDDDERIGLRRPAQHCLEVGGGVEAVGARRRTRVGPVVAEGGPGRHARPRAESTADEAEPQHADRRSRCSSHRTSVSHCADDLGNRAEATTVASMAASGNDSDGDLDGFAIAVVREETAWKVTALKPSALTDLADAERQLRDLRAVGAVFGLLDVDDEFFVVLRPAPGVHGSCSPTPLPPSTTTSPPTPSRR